jgi:hypothetical protein
MSANEAVQPIAHFTDGFVPPSYFFIVTKEGSACKADGNNAKVGVVDR